jgi:hypothetical protein
MTGYLKNATIAVDALSIWYRNIFPAPCFFSVHYEKQIALKLIALLIILLLQHEHQWVGDDDPFSFLRWYRVPVLIPSLTFLIKCYRKTNILLGLWKLIRKKCLMAYSQSKGSQ